MARRIYTMEEYKKILPEAIEEFKEAILLEDGSIVTGGKKEFVVAENAPITLKEQVERILGSYLFNISMKSKGFETLEDFEDFDINEEDPLDMPTGLEVKDLVEEEIPPQVNNTDDAPAEEPVEAASIPDSTPSGTPGVENGDPPKPA